MVLNKGIPQMITFLCVSNATLLLLYSLKTFLYPLIQQPMQTLLLDLESLQPEDA